MFGLEVTIFKDEVGRWSKKDAVMCERKKDVRKYNEQDELKITSEGVYHKCAPFI